MSIAMSAMSGLTPSSGQRPTRPISSSTRTSRSTRSVTNAAPRQTQPRFASLRNLGGNSRRTTSGGTTSGGTTSGGTTSGGTTSGGTTHGSTDGETASAGSRASKRPPLCSKCAKIVDVDLATENERLLREIAEKDAKLVQLQNKVKELQETIDKELKDNALYSTFRSAREMQRKNGTTANPTNGNEPVAVGMFGASSPSSRKLTTGTTATTTTLKGNPSTANGTAASSPSTKIPLRSNSGGKAITSSKSVDSEESIETRVVDKNLSRNSSKNDNDDDDDDDDDQFPLHHEMPRLARRPSTSSNAPSLGDMSRRSVRIRGMEDDGDNETSFQPVRRPKAPSPPPREGALPPLPPPPKMLPYEQCNAKTPTITNRRILRPAAKKTKKKEPMAILKREQQLDNASLSDESSMDSSYVSLLSQKLPSILDSHANRVEEEEEEEEEEDVYATTIPHDDTPSSTTTTSANDGPLRRVTDSVMTDPYGEQGRYTGTLDDSTGHPQGFGTMIYETPARTYVGQFDQGRWHGRGKLTHGSQDNSAEPLEEYDGEFQQDERHGHGMFVRTTRDSNNEVSVRKYVGDFRHNKLHGHGTLSCKDYQYKGGFVDGQRDGQGELYFANGTSYDGMFRKDVYDGHGRQTYPDDSFYEGEFSNHVRHGRGRQVMADGRVGHDGMWRNDEPVLKGT